MKQRFRLLTYRLHDVTLNSTALPWDGCLLAL